MYRSIEVLEENKYYPFGLKHEGYNPTAGNTAYQYKYNGKELQTESGMLDYGWRQYMPELGRWNGMDQLAESYSFATPFAYVANNPIMRIDPDGRKIFSTEVKANKDGTYTVVNAKNDGDTGIYIADDKGNYDIDISEKIAETMTPYDFMMTNDTTGELFFNKSANGVTFNLNNLGITAKIDGHTVINGDANALLRFGENIYTNALDQNGINDSSNALALLSRNKSVLDFKVSLGLNKYTPVQNGFTGKGLPIITTLRAIGNMVFGANMNIAQNFSGQSEMSFYKSTMPVVGSYNQFQNNKEGFYTGKIYNSGFPYYGEHTYSGSYIYMGYWKHFYNK